MVGVLVLVMDAALCEVMSVLNSRLVLSSTFVAKSKRYIATPNFRINKITVGFFDYPQQKRCNLSSKILAKAFLAGHYCAVVAPKTVQWI